MKNLPMLQYLRQVEKTDCPGLISNAREWVGEGWGVETEATPEQLAGAMLMEATTQDSCVSAGESAPEYPVQLRTIAHKILRLAGHNDPAILKACEENIALGSVYEAGGNIQGARQLRAVGNLFGALYHGHAVTTVLPAPGSDEQKRQMVDATYVSVWDRGIEARSACKYDASTMFVTDIQDSGVEGVENKEDEYVELADGTQLRDDDGVVFDY